MTGLANTWFCVLAGMLTAYAILDGYDLGVGAVHLALARDNSERRVCLNSIGPVWNGNEVWLLAAGGMMVVSFPRLYAVSFSGFYLALMVVLWLLILRGIAIEFRGQIDHPLWRDFWDAVFSLASLLLTLLLGVALGNVVRGLPIAGDGTFQGTFTLLLNPYALLTGLLATAVLCWHGVNYLRVKTDGELQARARRWSRWLWVTALALAVAATLATFGLRPGIAANFLVLPPALLLPALAMAGFAYSRPWGAPAAGDGGDRCAFWGSVAVIAGLLGSAAATVFPNLLFSRLNPADSLTVANAASSPHALATALAANGVGMAAVVLYTRYVHRTFHGKVRVGGHGY